MATVKIEGNLYTECEDEITPICATLASGHGKFGVFASATAPLKPSDRRFDYKKDGDSVCTEARTRWARRGDGFSTSSYPTRNWTKMAFDLYNRAQKEGVTECSIDNLCCSSANCPMIKFIESVLNILQERADDE